MATGLGVRWALTLSSQGWWDGRVCRAHGCLPSWVPGAALPTEQMLAMPVVHLLSGGGGGGESVDGRSRGWGTSVPGYLEFWYQRRKEK